MSSTVLVCVCFTLPVCSVNLKHTQATVDLGWCDQLYLIFQNGDIDYICTHGRDVGCFHSKRSPKCGILSSKLRSPVFKGRRRRWGCGSVRAVSVWPAHVTCLLLRAMAVAKEQVTDATVFAMEQVVMAVVRAVSWCMRWCGEVRSRGPWADALSTVPACGFLRLSQRERTSRFVFLICPSVRVLLELVYWEMGPRKVCKQMWKLLELLGIMHRDGCS